MGGVDDIARHFGLKAIYVLGAWVVTRVFRAGRRQLLRHRSLAAEQGHVPQEPAAGARPKAAAPRYKVYHNPNSDFKPSNPRWLQEAISLDPADLATDLSWQCPLLIQFQATVAGAWGGAGGGRPSEYGELPSPAAVPFGRPARQQLFALEPGVTYLNHGSYGAAFRLTLDVQTWYQRQLEGQPVRFMETVALKGLVWAVADAARFVGASPADVVPVQNATSAINAVLGSLSLRRGDWVLMLNTTYPAVKSMLARVAAAAGASILEVRLGVEELMRPELTVGAVQAALGAVGGRRRVRLAVLDHVVSFPPVVLPVAELVAVCKHVGALVLVDGAHAIGNVPRLQIPSLGAHFYTTNLHKWGCSPKGAALLWAAPEQQPALRPCVTSHGFRLGFRGEFLWQGTADPSAWLSVPAALAVLRALGPERVAEHNAMLVFEAATALRTRWQGGQTPGQPEASAAPAQALLGSTGVGRQEGEVTGGGEGGGAGAASAEAVGGLLVLGGGGDWEAGGGAAGMLAVQLPRLREYDCTAEDAARLQRWLRYEKAIEVPVVAVLDSLWVRLSAQIYNEMADYQRLGEAIMALRR